MAKDATLHLLIPDHRSPELRAAIIAFKAATAVLQRQGVPTTDGGKDAKAAMESKRDTAESNAKLILKEAVEAARVLVAGGNEVGAGLKRADAVRDAGLQMLDRLFPDFGPGDSATWEKALADAKKRIPDALKAVGHAGDAQDHPCEFALNNDPLVECAPGTGQVDVQELTMERGFLRMEAHAQVSHPPD